MTLDGESRLACVSQETVLAKMKFYSDGAKDLDLDFGATCALDAKLSFGNVFKPKSGEARRLIEQKKMHPNFKLLEHAALKCHSTHWKITSP